MWYNKEVVIIIKEKGMNKRALKEKNKIIKGIRDNVREAEKTFQEMGDEIERMQEHAEEMQEEIGEAIQAHGKARVFLKKMRKQEEVLDELENLGTGRKGKMKALGLLANVIGELEAEEEGEDKGEGETKKAKVRKRLIKDFKKDYEDGKVIACLGFNLIEGENGKSKRFILNGNSSSNVMALSELMKEHPLVNHAVRASLKVMKGGKGMVSPERLSELARLTELTDGAENFKGLNLTRIQKAELQTLFM